MPKSCEHVVTVVGVGSFPIDMLRYDRLTPYKEEDSGNIAATFMRGFSGDGKTRIKLHKVTPNKDWSPTGQRWESFMWKVVDHEKFVFDR